MRIISLICVFCMACGGGDSDSPTTDGSDQDVIQEDTGPTHKSTGARAYIIDSDDDIGQGDYVNARIGDFLIANDHVRFVVRGGKHNFYMQGMQGGGIVDVGPAEDDLIQEIMPLGGFSSLGDSTVTVTKDGEDGSAEITVTATMISIPLIEAFAGDFGAEGTMTVKYRLSDSDTALEVGISTDSLDTVMGGVVMFAGGPLTLSSFDGYMISEGPNISYGFVSETPLNITTLGNVNLALGQEITGDEEWRYWLTVGNGSMSSVLDQILSIRQDPAGTVSGTVDDATAVIGAYNADGELVSRFRPNSNGEFSGKLPVGIITLVAEGKGRETGVSVEVDVIENSDTTDLQLSANKPATLEVTTDMPMRIEMTTTTGGRIVQPISAGTSTIPVTPGQWSITAMRGFEYEIDTLDITLEAGQNESWAPKLERVLDTTGWIASDFHLHSEWSTDSNVPLRDRILACAAEGVEYAVATDHDVVTDYRPFVLESLKGRIVVASGVETSTAKWGHINNWPHTVNPDLPGRGSPVWFGLDFPETMNAVGAGSPGHVVQINHPRRGSSALLDNILFDPEDPDLEQLKMFTFNAIEIYNGGDTEAMELALVDWLTMLKHKLPIAATGVSDSHSIGSYCGHPRTYVQVDDDDPATAKGPDVDNAVLAGRTLATSGPFLTLVKGDNGSVQIKVSGPSWMPVETIQLYEDGVAGTPIDVAAYDGNVVRFDNAVSLENPDAAFVVAVARASASAAPMLRAKVRAVSPALWLKKE
ncbi:MAG TPA: hypothetical protein EYN66_21600 [Myxococcales bacterium]|nr:hypothetical protein [Myxococcales bacterium]